MMRSVAAAFAAMMLACGICTADESARIASCEGKFVLSGARSDELEGKMRVLPDGPTDDVQAIGSKAEGDTSALVDLETAVGTKGTISFWVRPQVYFRNGEGAEKIRYEILEMPGIGKCYFQQSSEACLLGWDWDWDVVKGVDWLGTYIPELPGPEWYQLVYTWDAEKGLFDAYINGSPQRVPGTVVKPWAITPHSRLVLHTGGFQLADVRVEPRYLPVESVIKRLPEQYRGRRSELLGVKPPIDPTDVSARRGKLLYHSSLATQGSISGWKLEGPGVIEFTDDWMRLSSHLVDSQPKGHIVHWCPEEFPSSFVAEWEFRPRSEYGLCIVFYSAKGEHGESIFDPSLPARNGVFSQYTNGAIVSYHISYTASTPGTPGRITSNIRKNNHFYLIGNGPPGILPGDTSPHTIRLIKDGARSQLQVDGRVIIDYTDEGKRYGPVLGGGWLGLRQMEWTVADYRNLRVWELKR